MTAQVVPPNNHRRNYTEKAINILKIFFSGLSSLHWQFSLEL